MNFPSDLKYTKDHEWIRLEGNTAVVGITDFAQGELGDIIYVDLKPVGSSFKQHEVFGTVEAVKTVSDLFIPVSGTISAVNDDLNTDAAVVNTDPYGKGWMVKISVSDTAELADLMNADAYRSLIGG